MYLYNFPEICGVQISLGLIRRLTEKFPGIIAGVKDSGGDPDVTADYILSFSGLRIFTGNEVDVPELNPLGLAGTVCGLANVVPAFMRHLVDARNEYEGRPLVAALREADAVLSRFPFIPSAKAIIADRMQDPNWLRHMPPMTTPPAQLRARMVADYLQWLSTGGQTTVATGQDLSATNVLPLKSA
nr:dihydrodipicolinate synthase family protein [Frigidibacter sp. ROC022]